MEIGADVSRTIRPKLNVGQPGDVYEREADEVARAVMSTPARALERELPTATQVDTRFGRLPGNIAVQRQPTDFTFEVPEDEERLQAAPVPGQKPKVPQGFEDQLDTIENRGQPFPATLRDFFEPLFGHDFGAVRIHTDGWAHQMARAAHALAFTLGQHIVFAEGHYAPSTPKGQHLLAHELTHTIQQGFAVGPALSAASSKGGLSTATAVKNSNPASGTAQRTLQRADCNFYVYDSTLSDKLGTAWKVASVALAMKARGGYSIASGGSIEEMLYRVLYVYADKDCDCLEEIQFLSHGSSGNAMYISGGGGELTIKDFDIPEIEKYGDGPTNTPEYRAWHSSLTTRQRRLVLLRRVLCGPDAEVYYRSCEAFQGKTGKEFAKASATFWRSRVIGHTKSIGLTQPGRKVVKPGEEPDWPESEGAGESPAKKPSVGAEQKPKKD